MFAARALRAMHSARPHAPIEEAARAVAALGEVREASQSADAAVVRVLLGRVLDVVRAGAGGRGLGGMHEAVAHGYLARHFHAVGDVAAERGHRLGVVECLQAEAAGADEGGLVCQGYNALALACLRMHDAEGQLAAAAAAAAAERAAVTSGLRLSSALHAALARERGGEDQMLMLSALAAVGGTAGASGEQSGLDVPGFARLFSGVFARTSASESADADAIDQLRALIVRWDARKDFDLVEALCCGGEQLVLRSRGNAAYLDQAEDFYTRALRLTDEIRGSALDRCEPLLGLAQLYAARGKPVEAEGLFRAVEEPFAAPLAKRAFTVSAADVYCRAMNAFAEFLDKCEWNGRTRETEAAKKREQASGVQAMFPSVLDATARPLVPLWYIDSAMPHFELPQPQLGS